MPSPPSQYIQDVHDITRCIPEGRVTTYGAIADFLTLGSARMVGWALRLVANDDSIPAHRVVNRKGELTGRNNFATPVLMQQRLEAENIEIKDNRVVAFDTLIWYPTDLLL